MLLTIFFRSLHQHGLGMPNRSPNHVSLLGNSSCQPQYGTNSLQEIHFTLV